MKLSIYNREHCIAVLNFIQDLSAAQMLDFLTEIRVANACNKQYNDLLFKQESMNLEEKSVQDNK